MLKKGFTLIELLVVIAILGILISILLPALSGARESGRQIHCVNNLRQHGIAWYLYLDDHDERFPAYMTSPQLGGTGGPPGPFFGGKQGTMMNGVAAYGAEYRVLNRYLSIFNESSANLEIFHCPTDTNPFLGSDRVFDFYGNSYVTNPFVISYDPSGTGTYVPRPISTINTPHTILVLETCSFRNVPGHKKKIAGEQADVMALFLDGHVRGPWLYSIDIPGEAEWVLY